MKPPTFDRKWIAGKLREARDLMNDKGAHWTKGTWHREPGYGITEHQYCSLGGINKVLGATPGNLSQNTDATRLLASVIVRSNPNIGSKRDRKRFEKAAAAGDTYLSGEIACGIVMCFNDKNNTKWEDVKVAFTNAARSLR